MQFIVGLTPDKFISRKFNHLLNANFLDKLKQAMNKTMKEEINYDRERFPTKISTVPPVGQYDPKRDLVTRRSYKCMIDGTGLNKTMKSSSYLDLIKSKS